MKILENLTFMRNRTYSLELKIPRLMFYHIHKTGGMYLFAALKAALMVQSKLAIAVNPGFTGFNSRRIDTPDEKGLVNSLCLVATHLPYGWHFDYKSNPSFQLFTVVRDPFERILSFYTYNCMRRGKQPSLVEFRDFVALPENCNAMVRHFCTGSPDVDNALNILDQDFLMFDTDEHIPEMVEALLSYANLPNVMVGGKINYTFDEYKLDANELRPYFEELNSADIEFYSEIKANPRRLPIPSEENHHPFSVLLKEVGGNEATQTRVQPVRTTTLLDVVAKSQAPEEVFATFFK